MSDEVRKFDERVRLRAYRLWEQDGRPHGRNEEYWQAALRQIREEEGIPEGGKPSSAP